MLCSRHHLLKRGNVIFYTFYSPFWHTVDYFFPQYLLSIVSAQDEWLPIISHHEISVVFFPFIFLFLYSLFWCYFLFSKILYILHTTHFLFFFFSFDFPLQDFPFLILPSICFTFVSIFPLSDNIVAWNCCSLFYRLSPVPLPALSSLSFIYRLFLILLFNLRTCIPFL